MQVIPQGLFDSYYQKSVETGEISLQEQMQFWVLQAYCFWFLFRIPICHDVNFSVPHTLPTMMEQSLENQELKEIRVVVIAMQRI